MDKYCIKLILPKNYNMNRILFLLLFFHVFNSTNCFSQVSADDSLIIEIDKTLDDTVKVKLYIELHKYLKKQDTERSFEYINQAYKIAKDCNFKFGEARALSLIATWYTKKGNYSRAHENYHEAIEIFKSIDDKFYISDTYNLIGQVYVYEGKFDNAMDNCMKSLEICKLVNDSDMYSKVYLLMGNIYFYKGDYSKSINYYTKSLNFSKEVENNVRVAICLNNIGNINASMANYTDALEYYQKALKVYQEDNNKAGIADCINNIGLIHYFLNDFDKAIEYFSESSEFYKDLGNLNGRINSLINIGSIYTDQGNNTNAIVKYNEALKLALNSGDKYNLSIIYNNLGVCYKNLNEIIKATKMFNKSLEISKELEDLNTILYSTQELANLELIKNNPNEALVLSRECLKIAKETGFKEGIKDAYKTMSDAFSMLNQDKKALEFYIKYKVMYDSIFNAENRDQLNELEKKYQTEKKQQQIELQELKLAQQSSELKQEKLLKKTLTGGVIALLLLFAFVSYAYTLKRKSNIKINLQKEKIENQAKYLKKANVVLQQQALSAQMNPHFMYNSLNSVQNYILKNDRIKSSEYLSKFSNLMRKVLENSQNSLITLQEEFEALNLYVDMELIRFKNSFDYKLNIMDGLDLSKYEIPPLILQPFVENAIHHGLRNKAGDKKLKIDVGKKDNIIFIIIEDNGVGREEARKRKQKKLHTYKSYGTEITAKRIDLFKETHKNKLNHKVLDLMSGKGISMGTRIEIEIY